MKNIFLCFTLAAAAALAAGAYDYVCTDIACRSELNEKITYAGLNADIHRRYNGYTVEELSAGYAPAENFLGKSEIPMAVVNQYPELPVGCEVTCAAAMLNFLGHDIDKCSLADNYLPVSDGNFSEKNGVLFGADPDSVFIGDPYGKGYGCYAPVIAKVLNDYFASHGSADKAIVLDDPNSADLERLIDGGAPVIVWASIDMKPYRHNAVSEWVTEKGSTVSWLTNSHTLILTGYDANHYYFMDPNDKTDIQRYNKLTFISRWEENGKQSIAVKRGEGG
ncbi:MAG: C39 family peptidase [Ruminococcus sp.]|nr:C39 family peptidase [Ruminococcus sp.]